MTKSLTAIGETPQVVQNGDHTTEHAVFVELTLRRAEAQLPPGSLITEHAVVSSTAAATAVRPTRWWMKAVRIVTVATRRIFVTAPADSRPQRRHYAERNSLLEDSRMEREMHRL
jgi:hypothetical protein